jgi:hypothetical protein
MLEWETFLSYRIRVQSGVKAGRKSAFDDSVDGRARVAEDEG